MSFWFENIVTFIIESKTGFINPQIRPQDFKSLLFLKWAYIGLRKIFPF